MNRAASESRRELLIAAAERLLRRWETLAVEFDAGDAAQQAALRTARLLAGQLRELLPALAACAATDVRAAETGADLLCTAVRLHESLFAPRERIAWYEGLVGRTGGFRDSALYGKLLGNFGNTLADAGRLDEAESVLRQRLQLAGERQDAIGAALAQEHLGKLLLRRGRFADAEPLLDAAFAEAQRRGDEAAVTRLLTDRANACFRRGDAAGGAALLEERIRRCEQNGDVLLLLSTHHTLADRLMNAGRLDEAERHAERASAIAKQLRLPGRRAAALGTLGDIAYDRGQFDLARRHVTAARRIFRRLGNVVMQGHTATSLGLIARKQGRLRQAAKWYREALDVDRATGRKNDEATDLGNLAGTLAALRAYAEAIELYQQRLLILQVLGQDRRIADTRFSLAEIYAEQRRYDEALRLACDALAFLGGVDPVRAAEVQAKIEHWQQRSSA